MVEQSHEFYLNDGRHVIISFACRGGNGPEGNMTLDGKPFPNFYRIVEEPSKSFDFEVLEQRVREKYASSDVWGKRL